MQKKNSWWTRRKILACCCAVVLIVVLILVLRQGSTPAAVPPERLEETGGSSFVTERISNNYTRVSAGYTMPVYDGEAQVFAAADAQPEAGNAEVVSDVPAGLKNADRALRLHYGDQVTLKVTAPKDGLYALLFDYYSYNPQETPDRQAVLPDRLGLMVDGEYPFYECRNVKLEATWIRATEASYDRYGDEMVALPAKAEQWEQKYLMDGTYRRTTPFLLQLTAGEHDLTMIVKEGTFLLGAVTLC